MEGVRFAYPSPASGLCFSKAVQNISIFINAVYETPSQWEGLDSLTFPRRTRALLREYFSGRTCRSSPKVRRPVYYGLLIDLFPAN